MGRTDALVVAASFLHGPLTRTATSVIGTHAGETIIFAGNPWGFAATIMLPQPSLAFVATTGKRGLTIEGAPQELLDQVFDHDLVTHLRALAPVEIRLAANGLHLEKRGGTAQEIVDAIDVLALVARRVRHVERESSRPARAITSN